VGQSCTPTAGTDAQISTQPATRIDTSAGISLLSRATNANAAIVLGGTTINSTPPNLVTGVQAQVQGNAAAGNAAVRVDGGTSTVALGGSGLDAIGIINANTGAASFAVTAGSTLNVGNVVAGNEHDGIDLSASGGNIGVNFDGNGTIDTEIPGSGLVACWLFHHHHEPIVFHDMKLFKKKSPELT
jgi:autotransporter family porin